MENNEFSHTKVYALLVLGLNLYVINPPQSEEIFYTAFLISRKNQMIYFSYIITNILKGINILSLLILLFLKESILSTIIKIIIFNNIKIKIIIIIIIMIIIIIIIIIIIRIL